MSEKQYHDDCGKPVLLERLCSQQPEWAANNIRRLERELAAARAALQLIAQHGGKGMGIEAASLDGMEGRCNGSWCAEQARSALAKQAGEVGNGG